MENAGDKYPFHREYPVKKLTLFDKVVIYGVDTRRNTQMSEVPKNHRICTKKQKTKTAGPEIKVKESRPKNPQRK